MPHYYPGPRCSKHRQLNELDKRSTCYVFYNFKTKCTDIFVVKMREAFAENLREFFLILHRSAFPCVTSNYAIKKDSFRLGARSDGKT